MHSNSTKNLVLEEIKVDGYHKVVVVTDESVGLKSIIAIHDVTLGPALGGTRIYPYARFDDAMTDALRLAKGMTYKAAVAQVGLGGGKSVILADPKTQKTPELLQSFAQAVHSLEGLYICAEDVGCSLKDVEIISEITPYVTGLAHEKSSGNPAPFTAYGTLLGILSVMKKLTGEASVKGKTVAIQGLGSVGAILAEQLFWQGANLILTDIDMDKAQAIGRQFDAEVVAPSEILFVECDVLSPCAMGGILNPSTIPHLQCKAVAGCANNQLLTDQDAYALAAKGILYAPDFVVNAGGLINVTIELEEKGYQAKVARERVEQIFDQLMIIYDIAENKKISTHQAAVSLAEYKLKYEIGKRQKKAVLHHANVSI